MMKSRKEQFKQNKISKRAKLLLGTLFLSMGVGSSITVAFADQDIEGSLGNWFANQQAKSIETIEKAIMSEKEIQLQRLKEELQLEMTNAKQQMDQFTEKEKKQRIKDLKAHTDELIKNLKVDHSSEKAAVINQLNTIQNEAIEKMDTIAKADKGEKKPNQGG
ncbi:hypothetical protein RCG19_07380 [Neobacillus sp. OS1-2]|uniref:hypothetical protein n=1 Tax=Neobacillus sp. OS1-2 TaxID=3070680 RepID=UPI0027DED42C|nr:hypothetical protein [Neobacillus sp. OS1-2]WML41462.1 hypothetical protein RCG19_07380 [Neobacillus sp. OS1-2]